MHKGFSTIEIMMAFAVMMIVLVGVILADFGAKYWVITSQTSNEALYKAKARIEDLRAAAKQDFYSVISSAPVKDNDASCLDGGLCYTIRNTVTDISDCSKYAEANVSWQIPGYPASSTSLFTYLTNPIQTIALGGDCVLDYPAGDWTNPAAPLSGSIVVGTPTDVDVLGGVTYISGDQSPYLQAYIASDVPVSFADGFTGTAAINAIDAARDSATGRSYVYAVTSASGTQFQVIDTTDVNNPERVAGLPLSGVDGSTPQGAGWRLFYYDRKVYVTAQNNAGPELHVFDVVNPALPSELGSGTELGTTVNAIVVRDQHSSGAPCQAHGGVCRFAYLATSDDQKELTVLDVTDPANITTVGTYDLPDDSGCTANQPDATSLALSGNTLYVGRAYSASQCPDLSGLYTINVTDPYVALALQNQVNVNAAVGAIRVSGPYLFMQIDQNGLQSLLVRKSDLTAADPVIASYAMQGLAPTGIDFDGTNLYTVGTMTPGMQVISNP